MTRQVHSQQNNALSHESRTSQYLLYNQSVKFKNLEAEKIAYDRWRAEKLVGRWGGTCVNFAEGFAGLREDEIVGLAKNTKVNANVPKPGRIIITRESWTGHIAYILAVSETNLVVVESNFGYDGIIGIREIPRDSDKIVGYYERR